MKSAPFDAAVTWDASTPFRSFLSGKMGVIIGSPGSGRSETLRLIMRAAGREGRGVFYCGVASPLIANEIDELKRKGCRAHAAFVCVGDLIYGQAGACDDLTRKALYIETEFRTGDLLVVDEVPFRMVNEQFHILQYLCSLQGYMIVAGQPGIAEISYLEDADLWDVILLSLTPSAISDLASYAEPHRDQLSAIRQPGRGVLSRVSDTGAREGAVLLSIKMAPLPETA